MEGQRKMPERRRTAIGRVSVDEVSHRDQCLGRSPGQEARRNLGGRAELHQRIETTSPEVINSHQRESRKGKGKKVRHTGGLG